MQNLLEVKNLKKYFPVKSGFLRRVRHHLKAVDGVSFVLQKAKTLGLVGESGCGKTSLGRTILRLMEATAGEILFEGINIVHLSRKHMNKKRRDMQIIFQDPYGSLNPRMTICEIIREPLDTHNIGSKEEKSKRILDLLDVVHLRRNVLNRYPHEFSGGQRQRIGIARALALHPKFIVADEPVSALDVSVQSQVLNLISELQKKFGISFLFISHDLAVVQHISHDVAVMYLGKIVEKTSTENLYKNPKHPYTQSLLLAIPVADPKQKPQRIILEGDAPSSWAPPPGCPFHPRCPEAKEICREVIPELKNVGTAENEHWVSCHLY